MMNVPGKDVGICEGLCLTTELVSRFCIHYHGDDDLPLSVFETVYEMVETRRLLDMITGDGVAH